MLLLLYPFTTCQITFWNRISGQAMNVSSKTLRQLFSYKKYCSSVTGGKEKKQKHTQGGKTKCFHWGENERSKLPGSIPYEQNDNEFYLLHFAKYILVVCVLTKKQIYRFKENCCQCKLPAVSCQHIPISENKKLQKVRFIFFFKLTFSQNYLDLQCVVQQLTF